MGCLGARGESGRPMTPDFGDIGMEFRSLFGARGMGEFRGRSPGRGLMGSPGLMSAGAVRLFGNTPVVSVSARCRTMDAGSSCEG